MWPPGNSAWQGENVSCPAQSRRGLVVSVFSLPAFVLPPGVPGSYDARARVLLSHVTWLLRIPLVTLEASEECLLECLKEEKEQESE